MRGVLSCAEASYAPCPLRVSCRKSGWRVGEISCIIVDAIVVRELLSSSASGSEERRQRGRYRGGESSSLAYRTVHWRKLKPADHELSLAAPCGLSACCC
jgi:hypothetical protein